MNQSMLSATCRLMVGVVILALVTHTWFVMGLVAPVVIEGSSMAPVLEELQRTYVDRTAFAFRQPRRWEVVVFRSPDDLAQLCVKRVVGLPGETVALADGDPIINGRRMPCPLGIKYDVRFGDDARLRAGWLLGPHEYFVLGDNSAVSEDSRNWLAGPGVDEKIVVGRPLGVR